MRRCSARSGARSRQAVPRVPTERSRDGYRRDEEQAQQHGHSQKRTSLAHSYTPAEVKLSSQIRWIAATTLGLALAGFGLHFPGDGGSDWSLSAAAVGAVFGAVSGVSAGLIQWLMLRSVLRGLWRPVLSMAAAVGFSHSLGDGAPSRSVTRRLPSWQPSSRPARSPWSMASVGRSRWLRPSLGGQWGC